MIAVSPNFNFAGRCEEALHLYQKTFHAKLGCLLRYSNVNEADNYGVPQSSKKDYIEHTEIWIGNNQREKLLLIYQVSVFPQANFALHIKCADKGDPFI